MRLACISVSEYNFVVALLDKLSSESDVLAVSEISRWARLPDPTVGRGYC